MVKHSRLNFKGRNHTEETKKKMSITKQGKTFTEEHKINLSKSMKGKKSRLGIRHTFQTKQKISNSLKGRRHSNQEKIRISEGLYNKYYNKGGHSSLTKSKMRDSALKYIKKVRGNISPNIGKCEKEILDLFELAWKLEILRQYPVGGYFVDGYNPEQNIVFEIDEEYHHQRKFIKDLEREKFIKNKLNCSFIRITI